MGCYTLLVITIVLLRVHLVRQNKKKDDMSHANISRTSDTHLVHAFEDLTDRENLNFRYVY
jgi:hypothetical protein